MSIAVAPSQEGSTTIPTGATPMLLLGIAIIAGASVWCVWTLITAAVASRDRRQ